MKKQEVVKSTQLNRMAEKKSYQTPSLKKYGAIHLVTQGSTAATNGDGGPNMMA